LACLSDEETTAGLAEHLVAMGFTVERIPPSQPMRPGMAANLLFVDVDDQGSGKEIAARLVAVGDIPADAPASDDGRMTLAAPPLRWQALVDACRLALEPLPSSRRKTALEAHANAAIAGGTASQPGRQRVLVVEDHPVSQQLVRRQLDLLGWPCDILDDGVEALAALRSGNYAMLVTDCNMPRMSGYELATAWRKHEAESGTPTRLPIIAMTAHAFDGELARCRDAGMDDYLSKPLQLQPLARKILEWMPNHDSSPAESPPGPASTPDMDASQALRRSLLPMLAATAHADLDALADAIAKADAGVAGQRLHRILGALQLFTDDPLLAQGERHLEALHSAGTDALRVLPNYIEALRQLLARLG
jgi:CheY-like chemotaxis protein